MPKIYNHFVILLLMLFFPSTARLTGIRHLLCLFLSRRLMNHHHGKRDLAWNSARNIFSPQNHSASITTVIHHHHQFHRYYHHRHLHPSVSLRRHFLPSLPLLCSSLIIFFLGASSTTSISFSVFFICPVQVEAKRAACPEGLHCGSQIKGFFLDGPRGHLRLAYTGKGPNRADSCANLCHRTENCAFWMYNMRRMDGECKMWSAEQSPCASADGSHSDSDPPSASLLFDTDPIGHTVVGGHCIHASDRFKADEGKGGRGGEAGGVKYQRSKCPKLSCNAARRGFLYDHRHLGHLHKFETGRRRRPRSCHRHCMEVPGCAFWMYSTMSVNGTCTLWSGEQSPCLPEEKDKEDTAHFDELVKGFVIGGNCEKPLVGTQY